MEGYKELLLVEELGYGYWKDNTGRVWLFYYDENDNEYIFDDSVQDGDCYLVVEREEPVYLEDSESMKLIVIKSDILWR